jgi:hypothetical protein
MKDFKIANFAKKYFHLSSCIKDPKNIFEESNRLAQPEYLVDNFSDLSEKIVGLKCYQLI